MKINDLVNRKTIKEDLKKGDLRDMVYPQISIDRFESKLDDDNIVVAFFVKDKDPAYDLCSFIDKSEIDLIDAEVSNIPNEYNNYVVFVEFIRNEKFPEQCIQLVRSVSYLAHISNWTFTAYKYHNKIRLSEKNIKKYITLKPSK